MRHTGFIIPVAIIYLPVLWKASSLILQQMLNPNPLIPHGM